MTHTPPHLADPQLTTVTDETYESFLRAVASGFQEEYHDDWRDITRPLMANDRLFGATVDGRWVSTYGSARRDITVPGGSAVPCAAVTVVTVQPPYRRRGLLSAMMQRGLGEFAANGEPVAALWASEAGIYGRFGFAPSASRHALSGARSRIRFLPSSPSAGSVDEVGRDEYLAIGATLWPEIQRNRPGALSRDTPEWEVSVFDPSFARQGSGALRFVVHFGEDGRPDGFAAYRFKEDYDHGHPAGEVAISELHAVSSSAYAGLWRFVTDIDLSASFRFRNATVDEPLRHLLADARALRTEVADNIYVRLVDVAEALRRRQYAAPIDVVIAVSDAQLPSNAGRYRITAEPFAEASAERTDDDADIELGVLELGAVYLGGVPLETLRYAGRVTERTEGAVRAASEAFGWPVAPHTADHF